MSPLFGSHVNLEGSGSISKDPFPKCHYTEMSRHLFPLFKVLQLL